jgi:hypothetical protein
MKRLETIALSLAATALLWTGCTTPSQDQLEGVRKAAEKVLPAGAEVNVRAQNTSVLIQAHLLEGHLADEASPYVQGDYASREKLTQLVRLRCARIFRSIVVEQQIPDARAIVIQARHGVRVNTTSAGRRQSRDQAMTIYTVKMPVAEMQDTRWDWAKLTEAQIMSRWKQEMNVIPNLEFRVERK